MTFLEPMLLAALPIATLPIIIHLIHQRRFQSIEWGAMRFLLEAHRMARGYARIRQWLILFFRAAAIAALVFVISRPLASGWLGLTGGGRPDTTLILVDRSTSMRQQESGSTISKLDTGVGQLARTLGTLGSGRWVLIDSVSNKPTEFANPAELAGSPLTQPSSASADLPLMLQAAHDYISNNRTGQTEVWICSDLRSNDWNAENGRWKALRDGFQKFKQSVRFHLLAYPTPPAANVAVRVTDVQRRGTANGAVLLLSVQLARSGGTGKLRVPLQFDVEGARSELTVEMEGPEFDLKNHGIPISGDHKRGWGRATIPADQNPADNEYFFVFDIPPPQKTVLVTNNRDHSRPLELAASSSPHSAVKCEVIVLTPEQSASISWEDTSLLLWTATLPAADARHTIESYVDRGGQVIFFAPHDLNNEVIFGTQWTKWQTPKEAIRVENWRGDEDLFARTQSGAALPVGELVVRRYCELAGELLPLATLNGGAPLVARVTTERGGVYFCATTTVAADSSLANNGVAMYVAVQRALVNGAAQLSHATQHSAGDLSPLSDQSLKMLAGDQDVLSTEYPYQAGAYETERGLLAVNRSAAEDRAAALSDNRVADLFRGLDFDRVDDQAGNMKSLAREIWRTCLGAMIVAMVAEAALCLPRPRRKQEGSA